MTETIEPLVELEQDERQVLAQPGSTDRFSVMAGPSFSVSAVGQDA